MAGTALVPEDAETRAPAPPLVPRSQWEDARASGASRQGAGPAAARTKPARLVRNGSKLSPAPGLSHAAAKDEEACARRTL